MAIFLYKVTSGADDKDCLLPDNMPLRISVTRRDWEKSILQIGGLAFY